MLLRSATRRAAVKTVLTVLKGSKPDRESHPRGRCKAHRLSVTTPRICDVRRPSDWRTGIVPLRARGVGQVAQSAKKRERTPPRNGPSFLPAEMGRGGEAASSTVGAAAPEVRSHPSLPPPCPAPVIVSVLPGSKPRATNPQAYHP